VARIAHHHAIQVLKAEMPPIEDHVKRASDRSISLWKLAPQHRKDVRREGVGIKREVVHDDRWLRSVRSATFEASAGTRPT
jgi:hypothetical protein